MSRPLVVCAIPTRGRAGSALALLDALAGQTARAAVQLRVLVWDDASDATTREALAAGCAARAAAGLAVSLHHGETWLRMRVKRRLDDWALDVCTGHPDAFVAHLDDDVLPEPGWLAATLAVLRAPGARFTGVGSVQRSRLGWQLAGQRRLTVLPVDVDGATLRVWTTRLPDLVRPLDGDAVEVAFAGHRALLVRAGALADAPHHPDTLTGGDLDFSLALRAAGHRLAIAPGARIAHRAAQETNVPGYLEPSLVIDSWRRFHARWGFVRDSGAAQARMSRADWLRCFDPALIPTHALPPDTLA